MHISGDQKRLGFVNPTQINQLELNRVITQENETFKSISNKKRAATIKKAQQKLTKEKRELCINPHRSTNAAVQR
jgi:ribosomal protein L9